MYHSRSACARALVHYKNNWNINTEEAEGGAVYVTRYLDHGKVGYFDLFAVYRFPDGIDVDRNCSVLWRGLLDSLHHEGLTFFAKSS